MIEKSDSPLVAISLGRGVQSWTLSAMSAVGFLPEVDVVIHSDTGYERQSTYSFAAAQTPWLKEQGLKVVAVHDPVDAGIENDYGGTYIPVFTVDPNGKRGQIRRQCTNHWKIVPLQRALRDEMREKQVKLKKHAVELWLGITTDEAHRMSESRSQYIKHRFPLIEIGFSRQDCIDWLKEHNLPVPGKSSCTFCPFHDDKAWIEMKREGGKDWQEAVAADEQLRYARPPDPLFVHRKAIPLVDAVLLPEEKVAAGGVVTEGEEEGECGSGYCFI
jgi:hypothetical protein